MPNRLPPLIKLLVSRTPKIYQPIGADMPIYGTYDADFDEELRPYIERLNKARGLVECIVVNPDDMARQLFTKTEDYLKKHPQSLSVGQSVN